MFSNGQKFDLVIVHLEDVISQAPVAPKQGGSKISSYLPWIEYEMKVNSTRLYLLTFQNSKVKT